MTSASEMNYYVYVTHDSERVKRVWENEIRRSKTLRLSTIVRREGIGKKIVRLYCTKVTETPCLHVYI